MASNGKDITSVNTIRCDKLLKIFDATRALNNISLTLPKHGLVAVIGPNGAGKTTLIDVLTGFTKPDAGHCFFGETEMTYLHSCQIARLGITRTFQNLRLILQLSVLDNVLLACPNQRGESLINAIIPIGIKTEENRNREKAMSLLCIVGLHDKAQNLASELSFGQQKLLTLVCCLATGARILFLDEPVAGIHPEMVSRVLALLCQLRHQGKLVVFVEHDVVAVKQVAEYVIVMDHGEVIANGTPSEVLERSEILEAYLG